MNPYHRLAEELRLRINGRRKAIVIYVPEPEGCGHAPQYLRRYEGRRKPRCLMCLAERYRIKKAGERPFFFAQEPRINSE